MQVADMEGPSRRRPGFRGDWDAGAVAITAFCEMIRKQRVVKYQLAGIMATVVGAIWRGFGPEQWVTVAILSGWVMYAEMNNSAHEAMGDAVSLEDNAFVKQGKDRAAGTVVVPTIVALVCLPILFLSHPGW